LIGKGKKEKKGANPSSPASDLFLQNFKGKETEKEGTKALEIYVKPELEK